MGTHRRGANPGGKASTRRLQANRGGGRPGPDWRLVGETTDRRVELADAGGSIPSAKGWSTRDGGVFDAEVTETTRRWRRGDETATTEAMVRRRYRIWLAVQARTAPVDGVPDGRLEGALSDATARATRRTVQTTGGLRGAARAAALGEPQSRATATADPAVDPDRLKAELRALRERTRDVSVTVPAPAVGTGRTNPPARLREELADRRDELRGESGPSAAARTARAVRTAVPPETGRAARTASRRPPRGERGHRRHRRGVPRRRSAGRRPRVTLGWDSPSPVSLTDPAGDLSLAVDAAPAYLPMSEVDRERLTVRAAVPSGRSRPGT